MDILSIIGNKGWGILSFRAMNRFYVKDFSGLFSVY